MTSIFHYRLHFPHLAKYRNIAHFKRLTFNLHLYAFPCSAYHFPLRATYVCNPDAGQRRHDRQCCQNARPRQRQHDAPLCEGSRLVDHARHGGCRRKYGFVARCRTYEVCKGHPALFPEIGPIMRAGYGKRSHYQLKKVYHGMQTN